MLAKRQLQTDAFAASVESRLAPLFKGGDGPESVTFDTSLSSIQRRFVHQAAQSKGLLSASTGEDARRKIVVYRSDAANAPEVTPPSYVPRVEKLSRILSSLLRHRAQAKALALPVLQEEGATAEEVRHLVEKHDDKRRFGLCERNGETWIRANQGHTMRHVQDIQLLDRITDPAEAPCCVHGTYLFAWESILQEGGLSRMTRNHIHFAPRPPGEGKVISGLRSDAEVAIYVSVASAMSAGIEFFRSANGVILTRGDAKGFVPVRHFQRAVFLADDSLLWKPDSSAKHIEMKPAAVAGTEAESSDEETVLLSGAILVDREEVQARVSEDAFVEGLCSMFAPVAKNG